MEDNQIIDLYFARSESAIQQTEQKYGPYCRQIAYNILNDHFDSEECVNDTYLKTWNAIPPRRPSKLWLLAAIIALLLLLVGCAAAFLWLQDRSISQQTYTQRFDAQGHYIEPTEKTLDTVTLFGSGGSNMQKALAEWLEFQWNYLDFSELNLTDEEAEKIPERYHYTYDCYTPEMVEELERITEEYNLKLLDTQISFQRWQYETIMEGLDLSSLLRPDAKAVMENGQGDIQLPSNFYMEFFLDLKELDAPWAEDILVNYHYAHAEYFPGFGATILDLEEVEQWKYTTKDGTSLLLALDRKGRGIVLAEREDAMIYLNVNSNFWGPNFPDPEDVIDRAGLEMLADAFDYSISPQPVDISTLQPKLDAEWEVHNQELRDSVTTYAGFTDFLIENAHLIPTRQYAYYDLDGDGSEELLLGGPGVEYTRILYDDDGEIHEHGWFCDLRILENGGFMTLQVGFPRENNNMYYTFYPPMSNGFPMTFDYSGNGPEICYEEERQTVSFFNGTWKVFTSTHDTGTVIQETEAQAIIDQYPEKELDWQPIWEYPVDTSGRTIGDELSSRKLPQTEQEYILFYAEDAKRETAWYYRYATHFALRDMNGDGIADLLLSTDGSSVDFTLTWKYGRGVSMGASFTYLCEENVMCLEQTTSAEDGADLKTYSFQKFSGNTLETIAQVQCNLASGQWTDLTTGTSIGADAAQKMIDAYPAVTIEFYSMGELRK